MTSFEENVFSTFLCFFSFTSGNPEWRKAFNQKMWYAHFNEVLQVALCCTFQPTVHKDLHSVSSNAGGEKAQNYTELKQFATSRWMQVLQKCTDKRKKIHSINIRKSYRIFLQMIFNNTNATIDICELRYSRSVEWICKSFCAGQMQIVPCFWAYRNTYSWKVKLLGIMQHICGLSNKHFHRQDASFRSEFQDSS